MKKINTFNNGCKLLLVVFITISCQNVPHSQAKSEWPQGLVSNYQAQPLLKRTQGSNSHQVVSCAIQDRHGLIWFGTSGEGVYCFNGTNFTQYTTQQGLINNDIHCMFEDSAGHIWFGTTNGICMYNGNQIVPFDISMYIRPSKNKNDYYNDWSTKNTVWSIMQDKTGLMWFGLGDGVYTYNGKLFSRFLADNTIINKDSLQLRIVSDLHQDKNDIIWLASGMPPGFEGLCRFDGQAIVRFKPKNEGWFRKIVERKNGNLLLATRRYGLWNYDGKSFTDYCQPTEAIEPNLNNFIEDQSGKLWLAYDYSKEMGDTLSGLWFSNSSQCNTNEPPSFTKISNKQTYLIFEDKQHYIWFSSTNMELYCYNRKTVIKYSE